MKLKPDNLKDYCVISTKQQWAKFISKVLPPSVPARWGR